MGGCGWNSGHPGGAQGLKYDYAKGFLLIVFNRPYVVLWIKPKSTTCKDSVVTPLEY